MPRLTLTPGVAHRCAITYAVRRRDAVVLRDAVRRRDAVVLAAVLRRDAVVRAAVRRRDAVVRAAVLRRDAVVLAVLLLATGIFFVFVLLNIFLKFNRINFLLLFEIRPLQIYALQRIHQFLYFSQLQILYRTH